MHEQNIDNQPVTEHTSAEVGSVNDNGQKPDISLQNTLDKRCACGKQGCSCGSENVKMLSTSYVYAIGKVVYRFPTKSLQLELAQAIGRTPEQETKGRIDEEVMHQALTDPANRYIARQICYVLKIEGLETYLLFPTDPLDIDRLAAALKPAPIGMMDTDVIIGRRGPIASPEMCNGLIIPIVTVDQIYSFDRDTLMKTIPKRKGESEDQIKKTANAILDHILQIADNAGNTDEHRAINYLAVRYDEIYHRTQLMQDENYSFSAIDVRPSRLSSTRKVVDVIFSYENRTNRATQQWFVRVDVTEEFPFLVSPMQQYFER
jgi:PatG C-terminal